jgi:hypothetical protein
MISGPYEDQPIDTMKARFEKWQRKAIFEAIQT